MGEWNQDEEPILTAEGADRHVLYQKSVQDPEAEISLIDEKFSEIRGRLPLSLREDFCGTAFLSVEWCKTHPQRTAIGIDLDGDTLEWSSVHHLAQLDEETNNRITLIHANVLEPVDQAVDLICALNFSYSIFKTREELLQYFTQVRQGLNESGVFMIDIYGGAESITEMEEEREVEGEAFTYVWDQSEFNPIANEMKCSIHFQFPDGTRMENAFCYDWRLWSIPEVREILADAGFRASHVYWEEYEEEDEDSEDEYLEGTGEYYEVESVENQESWVAYIFAEV